MSTRVPATALVRFPEVNRTLRDGRGFERALRKAEGTDVRVVSPRRAHWILPDRKMSPEKVLDWVYSVAAACPPPGRRRKSPASTVTP